MKRGNASGGVSKSAATGWASTPGSSGTITSVKLTRVSA
jgi:hypothetical protein